jgi:hypothetical protein
MKSQEFIIALIHNNEKDRLSNIIPKLKELKLNMYKKTIIEYATQNKIEYSFLQVIKCTLLFVITSIKWHKYLNKKINLSFIFESLAILSSFSTYKKYIKHRYKLAITHEISSKHLTALRDFVDSNSNYVLIFESDAEIYDVNKLENALLESIELFDIYVNSYALIAEGFNDSKLGIREIPKKLNGSFYIYDKPFSNTLCAYFMNRETAKLILNEILTYPCDVPFFGFDWLFNYSFIRLVKKGRQIKCLTYNGKLVGHGSLIETTQSWQK